MASTTILILAAGEGTRMRSSVPKVLHELCGRPLVAWPILAALQAGADDVLVVHSPGVSLDGALPAGARTAVQERPDGTGGAVAAAMPHIGAADTVVVMRNGKVVERSDVEDVGGPRSEEYTRELFHAFPTLTPTAMGLERPDDARV